MILLIISKNRVFNNNNDRGWNDFLYEFFKNFAKNINFI